MNYDIELSKIPFSDQEIDIVKLYDFVDMLELTPKNREAIPAIFRFFEANSDKDLGSPLVHFLEKENDYIDELKQSLIRKPTDLTVWMVNRIINATKGRDIGFWMSSLVQVESHPNADSDAKESARNFIEYQHKKIE